jgi:hypothetical protein
MAQGCLFGALGHCATSHAHVDWLCPSSGEQWRRVQGFEVGWQARPCYRSTG